MIHDSIGWLFRHVSFCAFLYVCVFVVFVSLCVHLCVCVCKQRRLGHRRPQAPGQSGESLPGSRRESSRRKTRQASPRRKPWLKTYSIKDWHPKHTKKKKKKPSSIPTIRNKQPNYKWAKKIWTRHQTRPTDGK